MDHHEPPPKSFVGGRWCPIVCPSVRQIVKSISEEDSGSSISEEDSGSSISEEDSGSVKCELAGYASTCTFCHSIDINKLSLLYVYSSDGLKHLKPQKLQICFLFLNQKGYSKEPSQGDGSIEHSKQVLNLRYKKYS